jgi:Fe-S-cluster containining protein
MTLATVASPGQELLRFITKPTPQLKAAIEKFESTLPPGEFTALSAGILDAFKKHTAKLLEFPVGAERGRALHDLMDHALKAAVSVPISCKQGCSACCHYEVEVTHDEAEILKSIVQERFPIDRILLDEQASRERKGSQWSQLGSTRNRCVFLGKSGACQIYEDRPAICRKHLVTTPASACATSAETVVVVQVLIAEIILSAATSLEGATCGSLPKLLRTALQADERPSVQGAQLRPESTVGTAPGNSVGSAPLPL